MSEEKYLRRQVPSIIHLREPTNTPLFEVQFGLPSRSQLCRQCLPSQVQEKDMNLDKGCYFDKGAKSHNDFEEKSYTNLTPDSINDEDITEEHILQEIMCYFQGVDGKIIEYNSSDGYKIIPRVYLNDKIHLICYILDHGLLSVRIGQDLTNQKEGLIKSALFTAVKEILLQYHNEINQMLSMETGQSEELSGPVSLKHALCWCRASVLALQSITDIVAQVRPLRGAPVLQPVLHVLHHGNKNLYPPINYLFTEGSFPLLNMIKKWLIYGELMDDFNEFFIMRNLSCIDKLDNQFTIRKELKPQWFSDSVADLILEAGSLVQLVRQFSGLTSTVSQKGEAIYIRLQDLFNSGPAEVNQIMNNQIYFHFKNLYDELAKEAFFVLSKECKILKHLEQIRSYILMGKGDFINILVQKIQNDLCFPNKKMQGSCLTSLVLSALEKTLQKGDEAAEHLEVHLSVDGHSYDPLADFFCLRYCPDGLIGMIIKPFTEVYAKIFSFLWKLKQSEYVLKNFRKEIVWRFKKFNNADLDILTKDITFVSNHLYVFILTLQNYMVTHVVDKNWNKFIEKFKESTKLSDVVKDHNDCLKAILAGTLQSRKSKTLLLKITVILGLVQELQVIGNQTSKILEEVEKGQQVKFYGILLMRAKIGIILRSYKNELSCLIAQKSQKKFEIFQETMQFNK